MPCQTMPCSYNCRKGRHNTTHTSNTLSSLLPVLFPGSPLLSCSGSRVCPTCPIPGSPLLVLLLILPPRVPPTSPIPRFSLTSPVPRFSPTRPIPRLSLYQSYSQGFPHKPHTQASPCSFFHNRVKKAARGGLGTVRGYFLTSPVPRRSPMRKQVNMQ